MAKSPRIIISVSEETKTKLADVSAHFGDASASATVRRLIKRAWNELRKAAT